LIVERAVYTLKKTVIDTARSFKQAL